jgi:protein involved in polysaccharide export with SLBB domain
MVPLLVLLALTFGPQGLAWSQAPAGGTAAGSAAAPAAGDAPPVAGSTSTTTNGDRNNSRDSSREDAQRRAEVPAGSQDVRTEFQQMVEATTGRRLPIYGETLFRGVPSTFAPISDVPVGPGYILGPGDGINVQLAGQVNQRLSLTVDRNGARALPGIGPVHVAGMPFGQLNQLLTDELSKLYRNFTVNAQMGSLRTIQVFVVGQAVRPGAYSISSLSTLTNAIFESGGILPQGTMRDIQVKRNGVTIDHFDLYDLMLHGDKTHDIPLASGDVIFIPFVGPQIAIVGSIDNPAIYEIAGETSVLAALHLAGGETPVASGSTVRLDRIYEHNSRSIADVPLELQNTTMLQNGDILSVTSVIDRFGNAVTLRGNVANPGRYVWHPGMRISDLVPNKESLVTRNYWRKRNQLGQLSQDYQRADTETGQVEGNGPAGTADSASEGALELKSNASDKRAESSQRGTASGDPGGNSVGAALTGNNGPFGAKTDVILSAPDIYWSYAVIERQSTVNLTTSLIPFNLGRVVLDGDQSQNMELMPGDVITIFSKADLRVPSNEQTRYVRLEGEFNAVGVYSVLPGETLRGLLRRAGGFTPDAYLYASEFTRESTRRVEEQRLHEYADTLEAQISAVTANNQARAVTTSDQVAASASETDARAAVNRLRNITPIGRIVLDLKPDSKGVDAVPDIALEDGDRFVVPRVPASVNVQGQVYNANAFIFSNRERVLDYLKRAGGPDREADRKRIFLLRADGSVVSRQYAHVLKAPIFPGDTIVVPPILDKRAILQRIVDIAQIVGNFGLGLAAIYLVTR